MQLRLIIFLFCCLTHSYCFAQEQYGNEWIKPYQPYYKFSISSTQLFKITYSTLQSSGLDVNSIHPKRFQLYRNGIEVPIFIHGQSDGVFNVQDFIEFYAEANDGKMDSLLYNPTSKQPHSYVSLFADTAIYFLTVLPDTSILEGRRYVQTSDQNFGTYVPEDYLLQEVKVVPIEEYLNGPDFAGIASEVRYYLSDYDDGEGWASNRIGLGSQRNFSLSTPLKYNGLAPLPTLEVKVIGASNAISNSAFNHHVQLKLGADNANYAVIADRTFAAYQVQLFNPSITISQLGGNSTELGVAIVNDLGVLADFSCLSYAKLTYPRQPNLLNSSNLSVKVTHHKGGAKSRIQLSGYASGKSNPICYDLTNNQRILLQWNAGIVNMLVANDGRPHTIFLTDSSETINIPKLESVVFKKVDPNEGYDFLLVSHPQLNPAFSNYAQYRSQKFKVIAVTSDELYNLFTYGNKNPLAIKRLCNYLLKTSTVAPKYLLLAGRGYQNNLTKLNRLYDDQNLVPAIGVPSADALFTAGILADGHYAEIPVGRIPATSSNDLQQYLDKLIDYETSADSILPWRKEILHITGGTGLGEQIAFKNQFQKNEATIESKFVGGNVTSFNKNTSEPQQIDLRAQILGVQNRGVTLLSFYGHASLTILDVDIGNIQDLNNPRKYPLYYFSGCNVGNANAEDPGNTGDVYAKDYLCYPNKGAIGWLAHTNFSYTNNLENLLNKFYDQYTFTNYGSSIGNLMKEVTKSINSTDPVVRSHNIQWLYQGDPATVIYSPQLPDYAISDPNLFIFPNNASVQSDSFALGIIVSNNAKAINDSFELNIGRTLLDGSKFFVGPIKVAPIYYKDTVYVWFPGRESRMIGNNTFEVTINSSNQILESSKLNNSAKLVFFLPGQGLQSIAPAPYSIVTKDTVELLVQSNNLTSVNNQYIIELDTSIDFNSPSLRSSGVLLANDLAKWKIILTSVDTTVYYWRARLNVPVEQGGIWVGQSFTHIKNGRTGWTQRAFDQYATSVSQTGILFDTLQRKIGFQKNARPLRVQIARWAHSNMGVLDPYPLNPRVGDCANGAIVCILFDSLFLEPFINPKFPLNCSYPITFGHKYYVFDGRTIFGQQEFIRFVDSIDVGTYIAAYSYYDCGSSLWSTAMRNAFGKIGSIKAANINDFYSAFTLIGVKGALPGSISEDTVFNDAFNQANSPDTKYAISDDFLKGIWYTGSIESPLIGPSTKWKELHFNFYPNEAINFDRNVLELIGRTKEGKDTLLGTFNTAGIQSISSFDPQIVPYLRLKVTFTDSVYRTPNQFGYWSIIYDEAPEGTISPSTAYSFYNSVLDRGDSLRFKIGFTNISSIPFDSVPVLIEVKGPDRLTKYSLGKKYQPLLTDSFIVIEQSIPTQLMQGKNQLVVSVNKELEVAEQSLVNNVFSKEFEVKTDNQNPLMEVTFDGYRIMNGDYVSPLPSISISSKDENKFILQKDTSTFEIWIRKPPFSEFMRIPSNSELLTFLPAQESSNKAVLQYKPERLADGMHTLRVISRDAAGNLSGANAYEIDFNVLNESTISNFFPYPNPCTTQMRFVFTLTGAKVPDELLVRIMTVSGKVIREINQQEFGAIKIGNNISEFAWDGTDNFGDRVANGVYLYQVQTRMGGTSVKQLNTAADKYITHDTGKIYLMK